MTNRTVHELYDESGTVIMSGWEYEPTPCINFDKCGENVHPDAGIHQFCRSCYNKWASAWFKAAGSSEEE